MVRYNLIANGWITEKFFCRIDRGYDFTGVLEWFAERVDRIILLFDAHKLDISDEFKRCIEALSGTRFLHFVIINPYIGSLISDDYRMTE